LAPPDVFNVLLSERFWLNDDLVTKEFFTNKPRTNNKLSKFPKKLKSFFLAYENVRGLNMKTPKLYADSSAFTEDISAFT